MTVAYDWHGRTLIGQDGEKIGKVEEVYTDEQSGRPEWARISTGGLFGKPILARPPGRRDSGGRGCRRPRHQGRGEGLAAPRPRKELSQEEEVELFRHYGISTPREDPSPRPAASRAPRRSSRRSPCSASLEREPSRKEQIEAEGDTPLRDPHS